MIYLSISKVSSMLSMDDRSLLSKATIGGLFAKKAGDGRWYVPLSSVINIFVEAGLNLEEAEELVDALQREEEKLLSLSQAKAYIDSRGPCGDLPIKKLMRRISDIALRLFCKYGEVNIRYRQTQLDKKSISLFTDYTYGVVGCSAMAEIFSLRLNALRSRLFLGEEMCGLDVVFSGSGRLVGATEASVISMLIGSWPEAEKLYVNLKESRDKLLPCDEAMGMIMSEIPGTTWIDVSADLNRIALAMLPLPSGSDYTYRWPRSKIIELIARLKQQQE